MPDTVFPLPAVREITSHKSLAVSELKREDIRRLFRAYGVLFNDVMREKRLLELEERHTVNGVSPQSAGRWEELGYKLKAGAAPCGYYETYYADTKQGYKLLTESVYIDLKSINGIKMVAVNYYAWDQVEPNKRA